MQAEVRYAVNLTAGTGVSGFRYRVNDAADFTVYSPDLTVALADKLEIEPILQQNYAFAQWNDGRMNAVYTVNSARREIELTASANAVEYAIAYELGGGALKEGETNPETYTVETETFTLNNPTREGYIFTGWTGSNGTTPELIVKIRQGTTGELGFSANWTAEEKPTPTLKVESSADLVVGMATEDVIVRIRTSARPTSNLSIWMESRLTRSSIRCGTARSSSRLIGRSSTRFLSANIH